MPKSLKSSVLRSPVICVTLTYFARFSLKDLKGNRKPKGFHVQVLNLPGSHFTSLPHGNYLQWLEGLGLRWHAFESLLDELAGATALRVLELAQCFKLRLSLRDAQVKDLLVPSHNADSSSLLLTLIGQRP